MILGTSNLWVKMYILYVYEWLSNDDDIMMSYNSIFYKLLTIQVNSCMLFLLGIFTCTNVFKISNLILVM